MERVIFSSASFVVPNRQGVGVCATGVKSNVVSQKSVGGAGSQTDDVRSDGKEEISDIRGKSLFSGGLEFAGVESKEENWADVRLPYLKSLIDARSHFDNDNLHVREHKLIRLTGLDSTREPSSFHESQEGLNWLDFYKKSVKDLLEELNIEFDIAEINNVAYLKDKVSEYERNSSNNTFVAITDEGALFNEAAIYGNKKRPALFDFESPLVSKSLSNTTANVDTGKRVRTVAAGIDISAASDTNPAKTGCSFFNVTSEL